MHLVFDRDREAREHHHGLDALGVHGGDPCRTLHERRPVVRAPEPPKAVLTAHDVQ
ncbi:hypothetical protein [Frankia sp. Cppng1_Ct_nod]|uniref:hypothetical protein n=1 Tax=Frankia sp. Cppng1_Ct_nod TaxID=2897162 RepID=UPI002024A3C9|nr:hypothetical protein [Frankia sp. Cppng1_Ct_nod]